MAPPALDQLALAEFLARGELDRHLRRMRLRYRERRERARDRRSPPRSRARASRAAAAGLFATVLLPAGVDEDALVRAAAARGVGIEGLSAHAGAGDGPPRFGARIRQPGGGRDPARGADAAGELYALTSI